MHPFEVMAEPIRRRIVEIVAVGEHPSTVIIDAIRQEFTVTSAAVSHHLRVLRENGWVDVRHDENQRLYVLSESGIRSLSRDVKRLRRLWKNRLGWRLPGDPATAGMLPYIHTEPSRGTRRGLRGKHPDGFTVATHRRRDALRRGA
ncbi:MAG TPA: hypothetical protein VNT50_12745 [Microbacterium sp.]|uniref:ArsR/SmtB family transcription factor n=1 Tax=Microbacterium sp. TaxID=51671 RepID=UPI002BB6CF44|nr:hypothetical protein [Microbacterium sp.]HWI32345.1 hypothetical protein [Microbacterium sp.]